MTNPLVDKWPRDKATKVRSIIDKMGLCSCGTSAHWTVILQVLERAKSESPNKKNFYENEWWEFSAKVLDSWGLVEHGTGIGHAWLTEDGELLLDFLKDFGTDDHDLNDNSGQPIWAIEFSWTENAQPDDHYSEWAQEMNSKG